MSIDEYRNGKINILQMMAGLIVTLLIGVIDYVTGYDLRLEVLNLMPIAFVVWFVGKNQVLLFPQFQS